MWEVIIETRRGGRIKWDIWMAMRRQVNVATQSGANNGLQIERKFVSNTNFINTEVHVQNDA
jgi:hypothetical protein